MSSCNAVSLVAAANELVQRSEPCEGGDGGGDGDGDGGGGYGGGRTVVEASVAAVLVAAAREVAAMVEAAMARRRSGADR
jgi:hypothetical protein